MTCFNCGTTVDVGVYSFDMDLPSLEACPVCIFAVSFGDDNLLRRLAPGKRRARPSTSPLKA